MFGTRMLAGVLLGALGWRVGPLWIVYPGYPMNAQLDCDLEESEGRFAAGYGVLSFLLSFSLEA